MPSKPRLTIDTKNSLLRGETIKSTFSKDISNTTVHATINNSHSRSLSNILRGFHEASNPVTPIADFSDFNEKLVFTDYPKDTMISPTKTEELTELVLKVYQFLKPSHGKNEASTIQMESYDELVFTSK